jgi:hypothetical protein
MTNDCNFGSVTIIISDAGDKVISYPPQGQPPKLRVISPRIFGYKPPKNEMVIKKHNK